MALANRKVIDAVRINETDLGRIVGESLKGLRELAGLTQSDLAARLKVGRAAISKIENCGDVQISSLKRYVEALGVTLRLGVFDREPRIQGLLEGASHINSDYDNQLVLPIFNDELVDRKHDIVLSVRPLYSDKILEGKKTVELRRRFPTATPSGTIAYIYSTSPIRAMVGATKIENVTKLPVDKIWKRFGRMAEISKSNFENYFAGVNEGIALEISNTRTFSRPVDLSELRRRFGFKPPQSFLYASSVLSTALQYEYSNVSN